MLDYSSCFLQPEAWLPQQVVRLAVQHFLSAAVRGASGCTVFHTRILRSVAIKAAGLFSLQKRVLVEKGSFLMYDI